MMKPTSQGSGSDTTIAAIHKTRERISDVFNGSIPAISEAARKRQQQSGRATVSYAKNANKTGILSE
jgi:hypothetical protein